MHCLDSGEGAQLKPGFITTQYDPEHKRDEEQVRADLAAAADADHKRWACAAEKVEEGREPEGSVEDGGCGFGEGTDLEDQFGPLRGDL